MLCGEIQSRSLAEVIQLSSQVVFAPGDAALTKDMKKLFYDLLRPVYKPILKPLRRRLGRNYFGHPEMELPPPYEAIQLDVERHLHRYLHVRPEDISQIVIVGAHEADEVERMHRTYSRARFLCFEPNPETHRRLIRSFEKSPHVTISGLALSDAPGQARFYEMDMPGNGSLLEPDVESWSAFNNWNEKKVRSFEVTLSTLDREAEALAAIDLLWMDVQGAEGNILKGAAKTLPRTAAVFLEVALVRSPYKGALLFPQINANLQSNGFTCMGLGMDAWNGTGNALFVKDLEKLVCK